MAIAFLDLAASIPTKASVYSTMACPPCAEDRLGPPEQPSSRIVGRATSSAAERTYGHTPRWTSPATCSIAGWSWDARPTSALRNLGRGGQCGRTLDPCTTLILEGSGSVCARYWRLMAATKTALWRWWRPPQFPSLQA